MPTRQGSLPDLGTIAQQKAEADALKKKKLLEEAAAKERIEAENISLFQPTKVTPLPTVTQGSSSSLFKAPSIPTVPALKSLSDFLPLVKSPGGTEFNEDLTGRVREALLGRIGEQTQRNVSSAQGEAARRGLTGGSFEARRTGAATAAGQRAGADVEIGLALESAGRQREERLLQEQRASGLQQAEAGRLFQAGEAGKQREFAREEGAIGRQFTAAESGKVREFNVRLAERQEVFAALEAELQRAFQAGENEKAREAALEIARLKAKNDADMASLGFAGSIVGGITSVATSFIPLPTTAPEVA